MSDKTELELKVDFWQKRLDHTLQHTQTSTKLIYLVDGAVIGFCYFLVKALAFNRASIFIAAVPILLLVIINFLHAHLIENQRIWYSSISAKLISLLKETNIEDPLPERSFKSSHKIYMDIHMWIAGFLALVCLALIFYGCFGTFSDTVTKKNVPTTQIKKKALLYLDFRKCHKK